MSSAPTPDEIARDARWLAQALDPRAGVVRLVAMDREAYRAASFLDDRMLQQPVEGADRAVGQCRGAAIAGDARRDARWIFHIGHVGSTLVARLLGELDGRARRPRTAHPARPRRAAGRRARRAIRAPPRSCSRARSRRTRSRCVKATSFVSEIAAELVPPGERRCS